MSAPIWHDRLLVRLAELHFFSDSLGFPVVVRLNPVYFTHLIAVLGAC